MGARHVPLKVILVALIVLAVAGAAASCGGTSTSGGGTNTSSGEATSSATPSAGASTSAMPISAADAAAVRDVATAYWAAYNAYDPEKTLSYLEESYRASQDKTVRSEIGQIKTFGVKLGVSEKSAPVLTGADQSEMYLTMKEPTGTRTMLMKFVRKDGTWKITYVEEVK